jgi:hypothetical protein
MEMVFVESSTFSHGYNSDALDMGIVSSLYELYSKSYILIPYHL